VLRSNAKNIDETNVRTARLLLRVLLMAWITLIGPPTLRMLLKRYAVRPVMTASAIVQPTLNITQSHQPQRNMRTAQTFAYG
jgi:hypothetical protein